MGERSRILIFIPLPVKSELNTLSFVETTNILNIYFTDHEIYLGLLGEEDIQTITIENNPYPYEYDFTAIDLLSPNCPNFKRLQDASKTFLQKRNISKKIQSLYFLILFPTSTNEAERNFLRELCSNITKPQELYLMDDIRTTFSTSMEDLRIVISEYKNYIHIMAIHEEKAAYKDIYLDKLNDDKILETVQDTVGSLQEQFPENKDIIYSPYKEVLFDDYTIITKQEVFSKICKKENNWLYLYKNNLFPK